MLRHVMLHVTLHGVALCFVSLRCIMLCCATLHHVTLRHVLLHYDMLHNVYYHYITLSYSDTFCLVSLRNVYTGEKTASLAVMKIRNCNIEIASLSALKLVFTRLGA